MLVLSVVDLGVALSRLAFTAFSIEVHCTPNINAQLLEAAVTKQ